MKEVEIFAGTTFNQQNQNQISPEAKNEEQIFVNPSSAFEMPLNYHVSPSTSEYLAAMPVRNEE